jgi:ABC-2 type transport system permease protein
MKRILAVARKEFRQISRDPLSLGMLLGVPAMMLLLYGYALNFDVRHVSLAVQDLDQSAASRELVRAFTNSTYFDLAASLPAGADLEALTRRRKARAVLVIPEGFAQSVQAGRQGDAQLLLDGTDSQTATTVLGYANAVIAEENVRLTTSALRSAPGTVASGSSASALTPAIDYRPRVWFNPELKSTQFLVPGLIGFILMLTAVLSTALSVVREKERGTMTQLRVTPLGPQQLILGKTLPYVAISLTATVIILAAARILFGVEIKGPYLDLFAVTLVYIIGALGYGLLVSSLADTQALAFQAGALTSMLPAIFLSGFIFPIRMMPVPLRILSYVVPTRYYLVCIRGIILKGAGLSYYRSQLLALVLFAGIVLVLAALLLRRSEAQE